MDRREFIIAGGTAAAGLCLGGRVSAMSKAVEMAGNGPFKISLAQWSLHRPARP